MTGDDVRFPPEWEADVVRARALDLRADATRGLADGAWTAADLRMRIAAEERRLTPAQRATLWMALVADARLSALYEGALR